MNTNTIFAAIFGLVLFVALAAYAFYFALGAIRNGWIAAGVGHVIGGRIIRRSEAPGTFWTRVAPLSFVGVAALGGIVYLSYQLFHSW